MALTLQAAKVHLDAIFAAYAPVVASRSLLEGKLTAGKLYEAWVLVHVLEKLKTDEGYTVRLVNGTEFSLKSSPGPINNAYSHFVATSPGGEHFDIWTDVEFTTLGFAIRGASVPEPGDFHELDIVMVPAGTVGKPRHDQVELAIECKNTTFQKVIYRAALGVRRELSYFDHGIPTRFRNWPRARVSADPPSIFEVYSTDWRVLDYDVSGNAFGVGFNYLPAT